MALRKIHWPGEGKAVCGFPTDRLALNAQEVTCERCKKLLPEVIRTIWDLLNDEPPSAVEKPKRVRKPRVKPVPVPPEVIVRRSPRRQDSMTHAFAQAYGVEPERLLDIERDNPWSPWRGIAIGSVLILAMLAWTLFTSVYSWLTP